MSGLEVIVDGRLTVEQVVSVAREEAPVRIAPGAAERVERAREFVDELVRTGTLAYGITTGVGRLSDVVISTERTRELQRNLLRSHACGVGAPLSAPVVRAACLLRANALAGGFSGVRPIVIQALIDLLNHGVVPVVPARGSLGASGDLAPLAHLALVLIGEGQAVVKGETVSGAEALDRAGLAPIELEAKEGLALINGTQIMAGAGALAVHDCQVLADTADAVAALSCEALRAIPAAFDERIQAVRGHPGQLKSAAHLRRLLADSNLVTNPGDVRVQDAYTIRCIPQVHGASRDAFDHVFAVVAREINAATDNPLLFPEEDTILSGGNFHGQPLALTLDYLAIAASELANMAERRIERLVNPGLSGLPAFLTSTAGLSSGFMIAQYTAASLVSENKLLASPASVDSIPSSANQEDHVSMGTISARKALQVLDNCWHVFAIELLAAAQAAEFHPHRRLGRGTRVVYEFARDRCEPVVEDRSLSPDIGALAESLARGELAAAVRGVLHDV